MIAWFGTRVASAWRLPTELPAQLDLTADVMVWVFATAAALAVASSSALRRRGLRRASISTDRSRAAPNS